VTNSLRHGLKHGVVTALGTTGGIALQLVVVVAGLAALIHMAAEALSWIKWLGVFYLLYLGLTTWHEKSDELMEMPAQSRSGAFWRGFALAAVNPKTLLFNAAFLPQFVGGAAAASTELIVLAAVFLSVVVVGDSLWAVFAAAARSGLGRFGHLRNKLSGGFLVGAALGLALSRRGM
jgi:threonine/homoserine/homoserine lactone efflux protein